MTESQSQDSSIHDKDASGIEITHDAHSFPYLFSKKMKFSSLIK